MPLTVNTNAQHLVSLQHTVAALYKKSVACSCEQSSVFLRNTIYTIRRYFFALILGVDLPNSIGINRQLAETLIESA